MTYDDVRSRSRKRPLPMVRALSAAYLIEHEIATAAQAARFFGSGPRSVSARRRRFYEVLFREWFGARPEILLSPGRHGDWSAERANDDHGKDLDAQLAGNSRSSASVHESPCSRRRDPNPACGTGGR